MKNVTKTGRHLAGGMWRANQVERKGMTRFHAFHPCEMEKWLLKKFDGMLSSPKIAPQVDNSTIVSVPVCHCDSNGMPVWWALCPHATVPRRSACSAAYPANGPGQSCSRSRRGPTRFMTDYYDRNKTGKRLL